ncbi:hypothetical protein [Priestia aryabhattai]|uniref:hypothetical protein n=1 Tax=Priestia aryabhattai TaxID=412384 RepID=UPI00187702A7|nr:hypothetical protein [Priestia aryabhattai]MBE5102239.1 hypothetical protein [Priestia aryabhattai]
MEEFLNEKDIIVFLMLTGSLFVAIWNIPFHTTLVMMGYFLLLFIYLLIKVVINKRDRKSTSIKTLVVILLTLFIIEGVLNLLY